MLLNKKWKALLVLAAAVCMALSGCAPSVSGGQPDAEVLSNGGIAAVQGDYVYYINGSMPAMLSDALSGGKHGRGHLIRHLNSGRTVQGHNIQTRAALV